MLLTKKQKEQLLCSMSMGDLVKIFETTNIGWLSRRKMELVNDMYGWKILLVEGIEYTRFNPNWLKGIGL